MALADSLPTRGAKAEAFRRMEEAVAEQGGFRFAARMLAYTLRRYLLEAGIGVNPKTGMGYLTQRVIPEYVEEVGPIPGLFWEGRGVLVEPHSRRRTILGTREAEDYEIPPLTFGNLLIIEKMGYQESVLSTDLLERYDLAVAFTQGYATTGARQIVSAMQAGHVNVFTVHDADLDGYNLARTVGEATARMPGHHVMVTDLGLTIEEALAGFTDRGGVLHRPASEPFTPKISRNGREVDPPKALVESLSPTARDWLLVRRRRFELNALEPIPVFLAWLEGKIAGAGIGKVVPPEVDAADQAKACAEREVRWAVDDALADLLDLGALRGRFVSRVTAQARPAGGWASGIVLAFSDDARTPWRQVVDEAVADTVEGMAEKVEAALAAYLDSWRRADEDGGGEAQ